MKKHHTFERRKTKVLLASALAAASVCTLVSCADSSELSELPTTTLESTYQTETTESSHSESLQTTPFEAMASSSETTSKAETETTAATTTESTTTAVTTTETETTVETTRTPVIRKETSEERITVPYRTEYVYSDHYDKGTTVLIQEGRYGILSRVTVTTFEDDIATDAAVTETIVKEAVDQVYAIGTREIVISREEIREIEDTIPFKTDIQKDDTRYDDERTVIQKGADGYTEVTYRITYENGTMIAKEELARNVIAPINEIISVGTKPAWTEKTVTEREHTVPYETEYIYDNTLAEGKRIVKTAGENGYTACVYKMKYYRGEFSSRELIKSTVYEPRTEVVIVGTKKEEAFGLPFYAGKGYTLTQDFGGSHYAMDFGVWYGDPILSIGEGTVIYAYDEGDFSKNDLNWTYGTFVVIEHENGIRSLYAHLKSRTVRKGQKVSKGQVIGYSGNTGRVNPMPTPSNPLAGTHLHFEIRVNNVKVDPKDYIPDF